MISVIIPAHNESLVIRRTLRAITERARPQEIEVIVVCNGCTDDTAAVAAEFRPAVKVIQTSEGSKPLALNLGDQAATGFPRLYVDADVLLTIEAIRKLAARLEDGSVLAAAPTAAPDLAGCSWAVRATYEIRSRLPSAREGIGGSGVYGLSEAGHRRIGQFPRIIADDGYVRLSFTQNERETLADVHSTVFPPRTIRDLIATKTRAHYGTFELAQVFPELLKRQGKTNNDALVGLFKYPWLWHKLFVYSIVTMVSRHRARKALRQGALSWQRDETSRVAVEQSHAAR
ncbi:MAG TPA: glycosyltransferase family 2 protein [Verrucomicrobiae bacterium]|nr:glycosyltransferase family 2 protein [Verrucomicrobiae bacterium]